ncbi:EF-hand domain-containing protein [Allohahella marinimesophila]|uniref:EF-hand domain-containing protein n=1 Tax=Allohahella marinimesophila TaxID=1054972 RepID=A0ABP7Q8M5_9GAMM
MNKVTSASILSAAVFALGISGPVAADTTQQPAATQGTTGTTGQTTGSDSMDTTQSPSGANTSGQSAAADLPEFNQLDQNGDGFIEESDVQDAGDSSQVVYRNFDVIDVDRDGQISEQEYSIIKPEATASGQEDRTDSMGVEPTNEGQTLDETYQP